jgi:hypothetical protein
MKKGTKEAHMARKVGGTTVKGGFYWNPKGWEILTVDGPSGILPGTADDRYFRIPVLAMLFLAPVMGGLFVIFLPVIGFALVLQHLGRLGMAGTRRAAASLLATVSPTWRPGEAYFAGKHKGQTPTAEPQFGDKDFDPEK